MLNNKKTTKEEKSGENNINSSNNNEIDVQKELFYYSATNLNIGDLNLILQDNSEIISVIDIRHNSEDIPISRSLNNFVLKSNSTTNGNIFQNIKNITLNDDININNENEHIEVFKNEIKENIPFLNDHKNNINNSHKIINNNMNPKENEKEKEDRKIDEKEEKKIAIKDELQLKFKDTKKKMEMMKYRANGKREITDQKREGAFNERASSQRKSAATRTKI